MHMADSETFIFAGGGSGGHLFPGIAVAEEVRRRNPSCRIVFIGSDRPVERAILAPLGFAHHALPVKPLCDAMRSPGQFLRGNFAALRQAQRVLKIECPGWVVGLGGFASAPTVWSAWREGIPVLLMEQNVIPGAATRWLGGCASRICLSYAESQQKFCRGLPTVVTGNPVRQTIRDVTGLRQTWAKTACGTRTLLILGGSQGAEALNEAVMALLPGLRNVLSGWRIVHQTGKGRAEAIRQRYLQQSLEAVVEEFFPEMGQRYAEADLAISRAGATTLAELACVGCPALLVPYPHAADDHQTANADVFVRNGAAVLIRQGATATETAERLRQPLIDLLSDRHQREAMGQLMRRLARPDAARDIADLLLKHVGRGRRPQPQELGP
jgi:UDP-N-acetylglucosamine--N-acetylmuramyl-(pentapeptide) pyrophosphoryl-undecaprenol N-acetylglucosamine transferase